MRPRETGSAQRREGRLEIISKRPLKLTILKLAVFRPPRLNLQEGVEEARNALKILEIGVKALQRYSVTKVFLNPCKTRLLGLVLILLYIYSNINTKNFSFQFESRFLKIHPPRVADLGVTL